MLIHVRDSADDWSVKCSIAPSEFYLPPGGQVEFTVVFTPPAVGNYSRQFHMSCDNGQMLTFTLQGEFVC